MTEKTTISGRVPTDIEERFEEYRAQHDLSKSDAMRRLLDEGLEVMEEGWDRRSNQLSYVDRTIQFTLSAFFWTILAGAIGFATILSNVVKPDFVPGNVFEILLAVSILGFISFGIVTALGIAFVLVLRSEAVMAHFDTDQAIR